MSDGGAPSVCTAKYADELFDTSTELGRDLAAVDWSATALGPPTTWPASLRNIVRLMLGSRFAMWMAWGPELTFFCNDAYRTTTLGTKYPWALGRRADEVWEEIWPDIGPRIESVISTGGATWDESLLLFLERSGYSEETYHTFSYSPITDDTARYAACSASSVRTPRESSASAGCGSSATSVPAPRRRRKSSRQRRGSRLTLYTDGLVERRGGDIDAAIARLARLLDGADRAVEEVPNTVIDALVPGRPSDDVAMLIVAARLPGTSGVALPVPPADTGAGEARRASISALAQWGINGGIVSDIALIISELVTNALRHGTPPIELRLRHEKVDHRRIVVDVSDGALLQPTVREMDPAAPTGRGLHLVSALSRAWGVRPTGNGKSVWCVIDF